MQVDLFFYRDPEEAKEKEDEDVPQIADYGTADYVAPVIGGADQWPTQVSDAPWPTDATTSVPAAPVVDWTAEPGFTCQRFSVVNFVVESSHFDCNILGFYRLLVTFMLNHIICYQVCICFQSCAYSDTNLFLPYLVYVRVQAQLGESGIRFLQHKSLLPRLKVFLLLVAGNYEILKGARHNVVESVVG